MALLLACAAPLSAADADLADLLRPDHPDSYTVVKGDTLWDISGRFLQQPWQWPALWRNNPDIENPHLIYPGDVISLRWVGGRPVLSLERGQRTVRLTPNGTERLRPKVRATPLTSAIPAISLEAIGSFIVENRIVGPGELTDAAYVLQGDTERLIMGSGDTLYARGDLAEDAAYGIVRRGDTYRDPETGELLGIEAIEIGRGRVVALDADVGTVVVANSREEVRVGDRLLPTEERRLDSTFYPKAPDADVDARIISVVGGVNQVGQFNVVVLNRGEREGLASGDVLAIFQDGGVVRDRIANDLVRLPDQRAGLLMVFRTFDRLAYGLVLETERPLRVGDAARNP